MKMRKWIAALLVLALSAGLLTGCGKKEPPEDEKSSPVLPDQSAEEESLDLADIKDIYLTTAGIPGDTRVAAIGEYGMTAAEVLFWVNKGIDLYMVRAGQAGITAPPWDRKEDSGKTPQEIFLEQGLQAAAFHRAVRAMAAQEGVPMSEQEKADLEFGIKNVTETLRGEDKLLHVLMLQAADLDQYRRNSDQDTCYDHLVDLYYGKDSGSCPTDEQVRAFALDELGHYRAKHILLRNEDLLTDEKLDEAACRKKKEKAEKILQEIRKADDPVAKFNEQMLYFSEDPGLMDNEDGYDAVLGQMAPAFEETALKLKEWEISDVVESEHGYHIIMRLPLDNIGPYREALIGNLMSERVEKWMEGMELTTEPVLDGLDVRAFWEKEKLVKDAVREEFEAISEEEAAKRAEEEAAQKEKEGGTADKSAEDPAGDLSAEPSSSEQKTDP